MGDGDYDPESRLTAETYIEKLKGKKRSDKATDIKELEDPLDKIKNAKSVVAGADYIASIPHAPWPSRAMLKRRVVLGTPELVVRNGVTRIIYPSGAMYEGQVQDRKRSLCYKNDNIFGSDSTTYRHGNGVYRWVQGDYYSGMWWMGLMHGLGVAEYASGAAYCGEWYLGERVGHGMYFYAPSLDEPHKEYGGQWANDMLHGVGKRLSKNGTIYVGNWKNGLRHGDGVCRVAKDTLLDPVGGVVNAIRRFGGKGATGRFTEIDAKDRQEIETDRVMGGIPDWHAEALGTVVQEGRFILDEFEPRDKDEIAQKLRIQEARKNGVIIPNERQETEDEKERKEKRRRNQARKRAAQRRNGAILASKDFPEDEVDVYEFQPTIQVAMEISDASELVAKKILSKYRNVNFHFCVSKIE